MPDTGMAMAAMMVDRGLARKSSTTRAARKEPMTRCSFTDSVPVRMTPELSRTISSFDPSGSDFSITVSLAVTSSTTATVF